MNDTKKIHITVLVKHFTLNYTTSFGRETSAEEFFGRLILL